MNDILDPKPKYLNPVANTKIKTLKATAETFYPYQFDGPISGLAKTQVS